MKASFGGKAPYQLDVEIAEELSPDPFSEEPQPHSIPHIRRSGKSKKGGNPQTEER